MGTETLYATSHLAGTFTNAANAVGNTPTTWAGQLNSNTSETSRWAIGDPTNPLTASATQTIEVLAQKGSNSGTPTLTLNLYENGTLVQALTADTNVTSTTGQTISGTFTSSAITNRANVEVEAVATAAGGSPSARNSVQIAYIRWTADTTAAAPVESITGNLGTTVALAGALDVPAATVQQVSGSLPVAVVLAGTLDVPTASVATIDGDLALSVSLAGVLDVPAAAVDAVTADLPITVTPAGALDVPTASIPALTADLPTTVALAGTVDAPATTPEVTSDLATTLGLSGALSVPTASVAAVSGDMPVTVGAVGSLSIGQVLVIFERVVGLIRAEQARGRVSGDQVDGTVPSEEMTGVIR